MAKPTVTEIKAVLSHLVEKYDELDMRYKENESFIERFTLGDTIWKVGFVFDEEDNMTIRVVRRLELE